MKKYLFFVLCFLMLMIVARRAEAQRDTTITDSTPLLTINHIKRAKVYLGDKLMGNNYELVMTVLYSLIDEAIRERQIKPPVKPK